MRRFRQVGHDKIRAEILKAPLPLTVPRLINHVWLLTNATDMAIQRTLYEMFSSHEVRLGPGFVIERFG